MKKGLSEKLSNGIRTIKSNWQTAPEGSYVPYKEIAAYSIGGAGVYFIISIVGMISLSASSMIVGASIGIKAMDLQTMNVITTLVMLLIAPTRAMLFDNTKSKMGKLIRCLTRDATVMALFLDSTDMVARAEQIHQPVDFFCMSYQIQSHLLADPHSDILPCLLL